MNVPDSNICLFSELIRMSIGHQERLSQTPTEMEWRELYALAEKQALIGICFCGVQRLQKLGCNIPTDLYMKWLGMAAKIQQRNELMNRRCVEVQRMLAKEGMRMSILKGQGVARYYKLKDESLELRANSLGMLRQSGDIDIYVVGGMERGLRWCRERYGDVEFDYINAHVPMFKDVEVELHWRVGSMTNLFKNKIGFVSPGRRYEERLYALRQCDSYGERYGIIMFFQSRKGICWFTNPASTSSYICVDWYVPISKSHQQMQESMFYERLGHTKAVREETLFRRLPQSITHAPYSEGRCSRCRINDTDDNTPAVAIFGQNRRLPI